MLLGRGVTSHIFCTGGGKPLKLEQNPLVGGSFCGNASFMTDMSSEQVRPSVKAATVYFLNVQDNEKTRSNLAECVLLFYSLDKLCCCVSFGVSGFVGGSEPKLWRHFGSVRVNPTTHTNNNLVSLNSGQHLWALKISPYVHMISCFTSDSS